MTQRKLNPIVVGDSIAVIFCRSSQGVPMAAIVDREDLPKIEGITWRVLWCGHGFYAYSRVNNRATAMHHVIMGVKPRTLIDHRNRRGLDNRKSNLRIATHSQNQANKVKSGKTANPYKGTTRLSSGKYQSQIVFMGKSIYLGLFVDPKDAALAYDRKAIELYGEFARLNFPEVLR